MSVEKHTLRTNSEMLDFIDKFIEQYRHSPNIRAQWKAAKAKIFLEEIPYEVQRMLKHPDILKELIE